MPRSPRSTAVALAAAQGRLRRARLIFFGLLLCVPLGAIAPCVLGGLLLPSKDRAFALLPVFVLPVVALVGVWLSRRGIRSAREALAVVQWADRAGFEYTRTSKGPVAADGVYKIAALNELRHVMTGEMDGVSVEIVNRQTTSPIPGVVTVEAEQTEATLPMAAVGVPDFAILPRGEEGEINDLTRGEPVRFKNDPDFDGAFRVYGTDPDAVRSAVTRKLTNLCLDRPDLTVVVRGGTVVVFGLNRVCLAPGGYDDLLDHALRVVRAVG